MRDVIVNTKTILKAHGLCGELAGGAKFIPRIALFTGRTGTGKTTSIASAIGLYGATYVRAYAAMNLGSLLGRICFELGKLSPILLALPYIAQHVDTACSLWSVVAAQY